MRTVSRMRAAKLSGVPYMTLRAAKYQGARPTVEPHRKGDFGAERWSAVQILAVRVARILDKRFETPPSAMVELINTLWNADENDLRAKFAEGRKFVLVVGRIPAPYVLFTAEEIASNEMIDYAALAGAGLPLPVGVDIAAEFARIDAALK